jgi:hypothetical protein
MTEATKPTIALLPCLWCGTAASFHSGPVHWGQYVATVWCSTEDCPIEDCSEYADSEQDARVAAAATWSTRTTSGSAHIAEERDRLAAENARLVARVAELEGVGREVLRRGDHDGDCDNGYRDSDGSWVPDQCGSGCMIHSATSAARFAAFRALLGIAP